MSDYYNLLNDSLRSGYLQVEKIYNRLPTLTHERQFINVRTGYPMKYRYKERDYVYSSGSYPLCWNSEHISSEYNPITIEKLLKKYEEWLADYEENGDNERIKNLIENELEIAKNEKYDYTRSEKSNIKEPVDKYEDLAYNNFSEENEYSHDSFLVPDDYSDEDEKEEEQEEDINYNSSNFKKRLFKKSLGSNKKNFEEEQDEEFNFDYNDNFEPEIYLNNENDETPVIQNNFKKIIHDEEEFEDDDVIVDINATGNYNNNLNLPVRIEYKNKYDNYWSNFFTHKKVNEINKNEGEDRVENQVYDQVCKNDFNFENQFINRKKERNLKKEKLKIIEDEDE